MPQSSWNRRDFLSAATCAIAASTLPAQLWSGEPTAMRQKPNIIFILTDDVGIGAIGCYGSDRKNTPHLDALAAGGTRFERCYATPLCGPTRCCALTGRYPFRTGVSNNGMSLPKDHHEVMLPTILAGAGYASAAIGKLGPSAPFDDLFNAGEASYWSKGYTLQDGKTRAVPEGTYTPDLMHAHLLQFIQKHRNDPFLAYYPMPFAHQPLAKTPDSPAGTADTELFSDNLRYMDKQIGSLVAELDRLKLRERTLIVFTSDNGTAQPFKHLATIGGKQLNGAKGKLTEGGCRVPLIVNWPGTTPAGAVRTDLIDITDFMPTFAELAGAPLPPGVTIDGQSFAAQITGQAGTPREWVYVQLSGDAFVRDQRWKLTTDGALLDLSQAPFLEVPVPSPAGEAAAARQRLQKVLDEHPSKPK